MSNLFRSGADLQFKRLVRWNRVKVGNIFIIIGPSGVGKTTVVKSLMKKNKNLFHPLTYTTRKKRPGESHGVDMYFVTETEWRSGQSQYCARGNINGHLYGTKNTDIFKALKDNKKIIILLDANGTQEFLQHFPSSILVQLMPTKLEMLHKHLESRWPDKGALYVERVANLDNEVASFKPLPVDYIIESDSLADIEQALASIIYPHTAEVQPHSEFVRSV